MNLIKAIKSALTSKSDPSSGRNLWIPRKSAGVVVNHDTALTYSAIWRSINLISGTISTLPWTVNRRTVNADGTVKHDRIWTGQLANVLGLRANDEMSMQTWRETMIAWALSWGNGYSEIERDLANRPVALWPIEPDRVTVDRTESGEIYYKVRNSGNSITELPARDVYHLKGLGFDGLVGYSVIGYAAKTVGLGLATEQFGSAFFENGATFSGVFEHPESLSDEAITHLQSSLKDAHGGPYNAGKPLILEEGMKFSNVSIPPQDAQFIETRKFNIIEIARWYGVPPHKLMEMDKSTFNNIEHQSIEFVQDALMPWIKRLETEADIKLVSQQARGSIYTKINVNGLLRGDMSTRKDWYKEMLNQGVYSINEVRALEDDNPIGPDGDKRLVQLNQTTLEKIGEDEPAPEPEPTEPSPAVPPDSEEDMEENEEEPITDKIKELELKLGNSLTESEIKNIIRQVLIEDVATEDTPQYKVLVETVDRLKKRELHRANDALKRYDDRVDVLKYMDKFYDQHRTYMVDNLKTPLAAVTRIADLEGYVEKHVTDSRLAILNAFDNDELIQFADTSEQVEALVNGNT